MRRVLAATCLLLLLISCSGKSEAFFLEGESVAAVYITDRNTAVKITVDEEALSFLREESGLEGASLFEDIFPYSVKSYQKVSDEDFLLRQNIFSSLCEVTGSSDTLHAFSAFAGDLRKTDFTATINTLSSDFDDTALSKTVRKNTAVWEYHLGAVISTGRTYSENRAFIRRWTLNIMRKT